MLNVLNYSDTRDTVLHVFASLEDPSSSTLEVLDRILSDEDSKFDININLPNDIGMSALHTSIEAKNFKVFERLLKVKSVDVNVMNMTQEPPLWLAVEQDQGDFEMSREPKFCAALLQRGARIDINITEDKVSVSLVSLIHRDVDIGTFSVCAIPHY